MKKLVSLFLLLAMLVSMILPAAGQSMELASLLEPPEDEAAGILWVSLLGLVCISCVLLIATLASLFLKHRRKDPFRTFLKALLYIITLLTITLTLLCGWKYLHLPAPEPDPTTEPTTEATTTQQTEPPTQTAPETTVETTVEVTEPDPLDTFHPHHTEDTDPEKYEIDWDIIVNDAVAASYQRDTPIFFGEGSDYTEARGIITFRGNNFRSGATYGTATVEKETLTADWRKSVGSLNGWPGCGWTGQPLVVEWDQQTKQIMNMYPEKQAKEGLVEVIYATLDGSIYFLDLDDGTPTRDSIFVGMNFKGAGALDPRGYPIMYVGSGDNYDGKSPRMYVISLIDGSILYQHGYSESTAYRGWNAFDSSPLVDAETDTLIWPGENGLLYTIKLNTRYDKAAGTLTVEPDEPVMSRYRSPRNNNGTYLGYEDSACIVGNYLFASENGGLFFCVDLNTMELIWVQDTKDDSNASPIFEWGEDGNGYIYTAPSLHWQAQGSYGSIGLYKLNAQTGEIVWQVDYDCGTVTDLSGGVQASPLLGKAGTELENTILFCIARSPNLHDGTLVALDTRTGEERWSFYLSNYSWSSPTAVYTQDGRAYILQGDCTGRFRIIDGSDGTLLESIDLGSNIEASPVVYGNRIVIGTRAGYIYGLTIS